MHCPLRMSVALISAIALPLAAQSGTARDSAAVVGVAAKFHASLAGGDSVAALAL